MAKPAAKKVAKKIAKKPAKKVAKAKKPAAKGDKCAQGSSNPRRAVPPPRRAINQRITFPFVRARPYARPFARSQAEACAVGVHELLQELSLIHI